MSIISFSQMSKDAYGVTIDRTTTATLVQVYL